ncbi:MAG TPA: molybdopterin cofactor-binding domain-containing protein [Terriglobales bacterium]|nr:molybdopterin cofactor-binding domain-containing protein [Terriglobales bacterium]HVA63147.1 molybdopterin cofactor-binding domain-containing protein [Terriglobales bacterium]
MNRRPEVELEVERYEARARPLHLFDLDRRGFMRSIGGGIAVMLAAQTAAKAASLAAQESGATFRRENVPHAISAWLHIAPDGTIKVFTGKAEVGQNIRTSLTQTVADELHVGLETVTLVMGDTKLTPFDLGTFGSRTTPQMGTELRRAAAAARGVLIGLAAKQWKMDAGGLEAVDGKVEDRAGNRSLRYAELAHGQLLAEMIPAAEAMTPAVDWTLAGKAARKVNGRDFVTGKHRYTPDLKLPGMLYGKVVRPSAFGATLTSVDLSAAQAMPGVHAMRDGDFIGVAALDELTAERAAAAVKAEWKTTPQISNAELFDYLKTHAETSAREQAQAASEQGAVAAALAAAAHRVEATYTVEYIAHCPLEPRAALATWENGAVTAWTGSQRPFGVQQELMQAFRLGEDRVRVIVPDTGSAYGGKHTGECAVEAARIARSAGKPVHLLWTREEEFTWAYFRPAGVIDVKAGISADGTLTAWEMHNYNSGGAALDTMYDVAHKLVEFHPVQSPLRQGSYRSLAAAANHFARESAMDELAHAMGSMEGMDPLAFRMKNLKHARLRGAYQAAAEKFGWQGRKKAPGHGFGIAGGIEKGGHIATCAEVAVDRAQGTVRIVRVVQAFDCGAVVNPDGLRNTISGAITQGIGGALYEAIEFADGRILNPRFSQYRVPRFRDEPEVEVVLLDRKDEPSFGAGETPIVGLAPAVGNAIFDAIGVRIRTLPMLPGGKLPAGA